MLEGVFGKKNAEAFPKLFDFFVNKRGKIIHPVVIDLTVGEGRAWENIDRSKMSFIGLEKEGRQTPLTTMIHDIVKPLPFLDNYADFIYFDPPYLFETDTSANYKLKDYVYDEVFVKRETFLAWLKNLQTEVPRVLKPGGYFIAQIMNMWKARTFYPNIFDVADTFRSNGSLVFDGSFTVVIQKRAFAYHILANTVYYLVFRKL